MGVRVDQPGELLRDYHTAHPAKGTGYITNRYYLADAVFVVGLESEDTALLQKLEQALRAPAFPLFLGAAPARRRCRWYWACRRPACGKPCRANPGRRRPGAEKGSIPN